MTDLQKLLAYQEIRQLASRYAICVDARDLEGLVRLFVPDVRVGGGRQGRDALRADFDQSLRSVGITFLNIGSHGIDLAVGTDDPDRATGIVYCRGEIQDGGLESERWIVQAIQYHDSYARRDGEWLFVRRRHCLVYGSEAGTNPLTLPPADWPARQTGLGSHPHVLPSWKRFWGLED